MSGRESEYKAGMVAMVGDHIGLATNGGVWAHVDESWTAFYTSAPIRPLVVIDPEDREQVERLRICLKAHYGEGADFGVAAALREFANPTPPKPDEPTGLGAVVEDAGGLKWVNVNQPTPMWVDQHDRTKWARYKDVAAVKVLSEGVRHE